MFVLSTGVLAHASLLVLDGALVDTAGRLASVGEGVAPLVAAALTGLVITHLLSLAWAGRSVVALVDGSGEAARAAESPHALTASREAAHRLIVSAAIGAAALPVLLLSPV